MGGVIDISTGRAPEDDEELLTTADVAKWLNVSEAWVRDHATRRAPRLPVTKLGGAVRFQRGEVRKFIAQNTGELNAA